MVLTSYLLRRKEAPTGGRGFRPLSLAFAQAEAVPRFPPALDQPSLITPPSVVKPTVGARGVEQIVWNFSEAVRVSLYPCPNLLARSRASNHKQGHDALSSHRMALREAYWGALQRTGQNCSPTDHSPFGTLCDAGSLMQNHVQ